MGSNAEGAAVQEGDLKVLSEIRKDMEGIIRYLNDTFTYWDCDEDSKVGKRLLWLSGYNKNYEPGATSPVDVLNKINAILGAKENAEIRHG